MVVKPKKEENSKLLNIQTDVQIKFKEAPHLNHTLSIKA